MYATSTEAPTVHLVCPRCRSKNRLPAARLGHHPKCGQCHEPFFNGHPIALSAREFELHSTAGDIPLLVDFWAPWCGPCRMMSPAFEQAARVLEPRVRLAKVNTDQEQELAARFRIQSIPTLALFKGGREVARQAGAMRAQDIVAWYNAH